MFPWFWISYTALWLLVAGLIVLIINIMRTVYLGSENRQQGSLSIHQAAPKFSGIDLDGETFRNESTGGRLTALLFASPHCATCMATMDQLNALNAKVRGNVVVVCAASLEDCKLLRQRHGLTHRVIVDQHGGIGRAFKIAGTPSAVILDEAGRILSTGHPMQASDLAELMQISKVPNSP